MKKSQNMISTVIAVTFALLLLVGIPMTAGATAIKGDISFGGNGAPVGAATWYASTGVDFESPWVVVANSGDYAGLPFPTVAAFTDVSWGAASGDVSIPMAQNVWTINSGGLIYKLDVGSIDNIARGAAGNDFISVVGSGTLSITGFDDTPGTWSYTAGFTKDGVQNLSFSAGTGDTKVPEPSALLLLGSGLAVLGFYHRRRS